MEVIVTVVEFENLQVAITEAKLAGRRILALSPKKLRKTTRPTLTNEFDILSYVLVTQ